MTKNTDSNFYLRSLLQLLLFSLVFLGVQAQDSAEISLSDLSAFENPGESWQIVGEVTASLEEENAVETGNGTGILVNYPQNGEDGQDLFTGFDHGDIDLELDYMMPKGSNSGIYLQGRYEVQLRDSWTVKNPSSADNGGIYERPRDTVEGYYRGFAPRQNASRAPGLWQHLEISFQAPRFDENGQKTANARIISAKLNGVVIHEDVELTGPTLGAYGEGEVAQGPLRFQGDHGAVAFRNISVTRYDRPVPVVSDLTYDVFEGFFSEVPDFDTLSVVKSGTSEHLTSNLGLLPEQFILRYSGTLHVEEAGTYQFGLNTSGGGGVLHVDGKEVISVDSSEDSLELSAGDVPFELFYGRQSDWGQPNFSLYVSSEGLRRQPLSESSSGRGANPIYVRAAEKPLLRSFMDLPGGARITHAISVSSLDKIHYTYDLNHGNVVQLWRGEFLNATPMWYSRGDGSSRPDGSVEYLLEKPALALSRLESEKTPWPADTSGTGYKPKGYSLDDDDNPTFRYEIYGTGVEDRIRVIRNGEGIRRTITIQNIPEKLYVRLAVGKSIRKGENNLYLVDDQSYYIRMDDSGGTEPFIRTAGDHHELIVPTRSTLNYTILF